MMRISIEIRSAQAQARIKELELEVKALRALLGQTSVAAANMIPSSSFTAISKWGSQLQWAGRQLMFNFTLPIVTAGAAVTKWVLDLEKGMVRLQKVYGDSATGAKLLARDIDGLSAAMEALSEHYAVQQSQVADIAGDWAAAGATAGALASGVESTLKTMVLGEMSAADATEALIAIQAQYGADTEGLIKIINQLNATENATGITFSELVTGMSRSAGAARTAGVDVRHLAAMLAALVPASGQAGQAGNALKTIFSRILAPANDAAEILGLMGINVEDVGWKSLSAAGRLEVLARKFHELEGASDDMVSSQASIVSAYVASRWNINRFDILMRDVYKTVDDAAETNGYYGKTLNILADDQEVAATAARELHMVLASDPYVMKRAGVAIQNSLIKVVAQLMPQIIWLVNKISDLAASFAALDPFIQKTVIGFLAFLAILGPPIIMVGALAVAFGRLGEMFQWIGGGFGGLVKKLGIFSGAQKAASAVTDEVTDEVADDHKGMSRRVWKHLKELRDNWKVTAASVAASGASVSATSKMNAAVKTAGTVFGQTIPGATFTAAMSKPAVYYTNKVTGAFARMRQRVADILRMFMADIRKAGTALFTVLFAPTRVVAGGIATMATAGGAAAAKMSTDIVKYAGAAGKSFVDLGGAVSTHVYRPFARIIPQAGKEVARFGGDVVKYTGRSEKGLLSLRGHVKYVFGSFFTVMPQASKEVARFGGDVVKYSGSSGRGLARLGTDLKRYVYHAFFTVLPNASKEMARFSGSVVKHFVDAGEGMVRFGTKAAANLIPNTRSLWKRLIDQILRFGVASAAALHAGVLGMSKAVLPALRKFAARALVALTGPIGWAIAAAIGIFVLFEDEIKQIFNNIKKAITGESAAIAMPFKRAWDGVVSIFRAGLGVVQKMFGMLPQSVQNVLKSVVTIVRNAALKVYEWFSYLNPFAKHSPSLVENVIRGMAIVGDQFGLAADRIGAYAQSAYNSLQRFSVATGNFMRKYAALVVQGNRNLIAENAGEAAAAAYVDLENKLGPLRVEYENLNSAVLQQESVMNAAKAAVDSANVSLQEQQDILDGLSDRASELNQQLTDAREALDRYASAPIAGMREMSDAMFDNELAQNRLRLALMDWEDVNGSVEDTRNAMASLQGDIESLRGKANDLTAAGAGSDVLGPIRAQISEMESAYSEMEAAMRNSPANEMQSELERLQREAERMDLESAIRFDPLTRQIEQLAETYRELTFDEIIAGITSQKGVIAGLESQYASVERAVKSQELAVAAAQAQADQAQAAFDNESAALDNLKLAYEAVGNEISAIESAINDVISASQGMEAALEAATGAGATGARATGAGVKEVADRLSPAAESFLTAAGGAYPDVGEDFIIGAGGESIDSWLDDFLDRTKNAFDEANPFEGFARKWEEFKKIFADIGVGVSQIIPPIDTTRFTEAWNTVVGFWDSTLYPIIESIGETFKGTFLSAWDNIKEAWGPAIEAIKEQLGPLWESIKGFVDVIVKDVLPPLGVIFGVVGGVILGIVNGVLNALGSMIGPIITWIGNIIASVIQVIRGVITFVTGAINVIMGIFKVIIGFFSALFTDDWTGVQKAGRQVVDGVLQMVDGIATALGAMWSAIWSTIKGFIETIIKGVWRFITGILDFFKGLYDDLIGHSLIPDLVNGIIAWFKNLWSTAEEIWKMLGYALEAVWKWIEQNVLLPIGEGIKRLLQEFVAFKCDVDTKWNEFKDLLKKGWDWIDLYVFGPIRKGVELVGVAFDLAKVAAELAWSKLQGALKAGGDWISLHVFDPLKDAVDAVGKAFDKTKDFIKTAWDKIREAAATPVNFVIQSVYTDGIKSVWDKISSAVGLKLFLPTVNPIRFAQGSEDHRAQIANGKQLRVWNEKETGGEAYIPLARSKRPRSTWILEQVASRFGYGLTKFEDGGFWNTLKSSARNGLTWIKDAALNVANFLSNPAAGIMDMISAPVEKILAQVKGGTLGQMLIELPRKAINALIDKAKSMIENMTASGEYGGKLTGWKRPSAGPITSRFGLRNLFGYSFHNGVDFGGAGKTYAANNGQVARVGWNVGYGNTGIGILINHGNGLQSYYGHNPVGGPRVRVGQFVNAGQHIGYGGNTGLSTGNHLHYSIFKNGRALDPMPYGVYDNGGVLQRGHSLVRNATGDVEPVLTSAQWSHIGAMVGALESLLSSNRVEQRSETRVYNFYGDLSFPNITNGDDAEDFIRNLTDLAGVQ
jgi:TP901 family phage tail tape measure protein